MSNKNIFCIPIKILSHEWTSSADMLAVPDSTRGDKGRLGAFHMKCQVPTPNIQDPLAGPHQELRGRSAHRSRPCVGSRKTPSEFCLRSHCQAFRRYASTPSTPVSSSRPQLEASSRSSEQPLDRPAPQGQQ